MKLSLQGMYKDAYYVVQEISQGSFRFDSEGDFPFLSRRQNICIFIYDLQEETQVVEPKLILGHTRSTPFLAPTQDVKASAHLYVERWAGLAH